MKRADYPSFQACPRGMKLLAAEDLAQQRRHLHRRIGPDLPLLLTNHVEDRVETFLDHVVIEIDLLGRTAERQCRLILTRQGFFGVTSMKGIAPPVTLGILPFHF